ncbi:hypothetical protein OPV22_034467 [Ensete ventricosum]|uniref:Uncharacterized protein n=1 Tax=Ensete ventricosum TaxID=4639 RepID=A0AAV8P4B6_ENSVE|nr:hypothetical protein OPV22_034467 [Ensete ventricosum]
MADPTSLVMEDLMDRLAEENCRLLILFEQGKKGTHGWGHVFHLQAITWKGGCFMIYFYGFKCIIVA